MALEVEPREAEVVMYKISVIIGVIIYRCCGHDRNCIDTTEERKAVGGGGSENVAVKAAEGDKLQRGLRRSRHPESRNVQNYRRQVTNFSHVAASRMDFLSSI